MSAEYRDESYDQFDALERTIRHAYVLERAIRETRRVELKNCNPDKNAVPRNELKIAGHGSIESNDASYIDGISLSIRTGLESALRPHIRALLRDAAAKIEELAGAS